MQKFPNKHYKQALREVTEKSFNQITVDGDTSTNDTVLVLANGKAENETLTPEHPEWQVFMQLLTLTSESLAKQIAKDGEGATKLIEVEVKGALNRARCTNDCEANSWFKFSENSCLWC